MLRQCAHAASASQAHRYQRALQDALADLQRANQERLNSSTSLVDKATETTAAAAEGMRTKLIAQRRNESRAAEIARELAEAPASQHSVVDVRSPRFAVVRPRASALGAHACLPRRATSNWLPRRPS